MRSLPTRPRSGLTSPAKASLAPRRAWLAGAVLGAFGMLGLSGCDAPRRRPLVFAANDWAPYLLLEAADLPQPAGQQLLHVVEMPSSSDSLLAFHAGTVDAAGLTLDEVLLARLQGLPLTVVAVCDESNGADMLLARPGLPTVAALRGRRVGAERSALGALVLDAALRQAGIESADVRLVDLPLSRQLAAWQRGDVDAVVSFGPTALALRAAGAQVLFDSSAMPGTIVDVIAVRTDVLEPHAAGVRHLLALHFAGLQRWQTQRALAREPLARRLGIAADVVDAVFAGIALSPLERQPAWLSAGRLSAVGAHLVRVMQRNGLLDREVTLDGLADARFLPAQASR